MSIKSTVTGSTLSAVATALIAVVILCSLFVFELSLLLILVIVAGASLIFLYTQQWVVRDHYQVILILFFSLLIPPLQLPGGLPELRVEELIIFIYFPFLFILRAESISPPLWAFLKGYLLFLGFLTLSTIYGYVFLDVPSGMRDLFEIVKTAKYALIIAVIGTFAITKEDLHGIFVWLIVFFTISAFIGQLQYHSILGMDTITGPLYTQERFYDINKRMMGTFFNPNTYGTAISVGFIFTLAYTFYAKRTYIRLLLIPVLLLLLGTVILTQSRTALGVLLIGVVTFTALNAVARGKNIGAALGIIVLFLFALVGLLSIVSPEILRRYVSALNLMQDPSWQMRLFAWYLNYEIFTDSMLFGWGPAKHLYTTVVDSEYFLMLRTMGIIGFMVYIYSVYYLPVKHNLGLTSESGLKGYFGRAFITSVIVMLVANITNPTFHEIQYMDMWSVLIGVCYVLSFKTSAAQDSSVLT